MVPRVSPIFVGISVTCHIKRTVFSRHLTTKELAACAGLLCVATPPLRGGGLGGLGGVVGGKPVVELAVVVAVSDTAEE